MVAVSRKRFDQVKVIHMSIRSIAILQEEIPAFTRQATDGLFGLRAVSFSLSQQAQIIDVLCQLSRSGLNNFGLLGSPNSFFLYKLDHAHICPRYQDRYIQRVRSIPSIYMFHRDDFRLVE